MSILVLAGDLTNYYLYKRLLENNFDVKLEGFNHLLGNKNNNKPIVLKGFKTIIAPIPFTIDGFQLYSPYSGENIHIDQLLLKADKDAKIIGGPFNIDDKRFYDITKNRDFTNKTVIPTCEEIIKIIIDRSEFTLFDSNVLINGEGRVKNRLTILIESLGGKIVKEKDISSSNIIINTSKDTNLINKNLEKLNRDVLIVDVSPGDYTIDKKKSKILDLNTIKARGLPGKSAPKAVSNYIYKTLLKEFLI